MNGMPVKKARAGEIEVAYKEFGVGDPLIFIMGYSGTMAVWDPVMLAELAKTCRVFIFDNRGMGSTSTTDRPFSIELFADDTARFMDAIGLRRAHILGYSMGGSIAQELALRHPDKVDKLILYAANCGGSQMTPASAETIRLLTDTSGTPRDRDERFVGLLLPEEWRRANPGYQKRLPVIEEVALPAIMDRQAKAMEEWAGSYGRLRLISRDTLLLAGADDVVVPPDNSLHIAEKMSGAWLVRVKGGGHGMMYQWPREIASIVATFLGSH